MPTSNGNQRSWPLPEDLSLLDVAAGLKTPDRAEDAAWSVYRQATKERDHRLRHGVLELLAELARDQVGAALELQKLGAPRVATPSDEVPGLVLSRQTIAKAGGGGGR